MKSFDTDLKKYAEKISLKASERRELRERILSYMEYHQLPKQTGVITSKKRLDWIPSQSFITLHFNFRSKYTRIATGVFAVILVVTPFIAERSVPGDALYLVKTNLNESIQGTLVTTPYEKIEFETKLMERRIAEARVLADEGKLTEEVKMQIAGTVKEHADAVQDGIAELRTQDADGAAIAGIGFNASLEVQSAVLGSDMSTENASLINTILTVVNDARQEVATNQGNEKPSFESLSARVEVETTRAYELFQTIKKSASAEEISDIERRLSDIDRLILEAKDKQRTDAEVAANDLAATLGLTHKLIVFMTDINIRESVALEAIVPVVLSEGERTVRANEEITFITKTKTFVGGHIESITDTNVKEKVSEALKHIDALTGEADRNIKAHDLDGAEGKLTEAKALIDDVKTLTEGYITPITPEAVPVTEPGTGTGQGTSTATTTATSSEEFPKAVNE